MSGVSNSSSTDLLYRPILHGLRLGMAKTGEMLRWTGSGQTEKGRGVGDGQREERKKMDSERNWRKGRMEVRKEEMNNQRKGNTDIP